MSKGRRGSGEGSIYKRHDGRWVAELDLGYGEGKRKRRTLYGKTRNEVAGKLRAAQTDHDRGVSLRSNRLTVEEFLNNWLQAIKPNVRQRTWARYEQYLRLHALPTLGPVMVSALSGQHLQRLYADRLKTLSPTTVHHLHSVLHRALGSAVRQHLVPFNVANEVEPPRPTRTQFRTLSPEEARRFLSVCEPAQLKALFVLALTTGLRQGELLALKWRDIDFEHRRITVRGTLQRRPGQGLVVAETKTAASRRQVSLAWTAVEALHNHRERAEKVWRNRGTVPSIDDFVFTNDEGKPLDAGNLRDRVFRPLLAKASVPMIRFHDLRHTFATLLLGKGTNPKLVSEMLGHSNISMTLGIYSHATPTMHRQAADAIDEVLSDQPSEPTDG
jgi:integrase